MLMCRENVSEVRGWMSDHWTKPTTDGSCKQTVGHLCGVGTVQNRSKRRSTTRFLHFILSHSNSIPSLIRYAIPLKDDFFFLGDCVN